MRPLLRFVRLILVSLAIAMLLFVGAHRFLLDDSRRNGPRQPTLAQVQDLASLVTTRVQVCDVVEARISGYLGSVRAALVVRGDVVHAVDLSQARFEQFDRERKSFVLILPRPQVHQPRVDHEHTRLFAVRQSGVWCWIPGDDAMAAATHRAYRDAQRRVLNAGSDRDVVEHSERHAEAVIMRFFGELGWTGGVRWA